jgi:hypothetical protein
MSLVNEFHCQAEDGEDQGTDVKDKCEYNE